MATEAGTVCPVQCSPPSDDVEISPLPPTPVVPTATQVPSAVHETPFSS